MKLYTPEEMAAKRAAKTAKVEAKRDKSIDNAKAAAQRVELNIILPTRVYLFGAPATEEA